MLTRLSLPGILFLALVLRCWHLGSEYAWYDEVATLSHLGEPSLGAFLTAIRADNPPIQPLYPALEYLWSRVFGADTLSLRVFSLIPMLASIAVARMIGEQMISRRAGNLAAFLLAVSHAHIFYSQEVRMYALVFLFSMVSVYAMTRLAGTGERRWWALNAAMTALIVWTHILGVFFLACQFLFVLLSFGRARWRHTAVWAGLQAAAVLTILPWLISADMGTIRSEYDFREMPTIFYKEAGVRNLSIQGLYHDWIGVAPTVGSGAFARHALELLQIGLSIAFSLVVVCGAARAFLIRKNAERSALRNTLVFALALTALPVFMLYLLSVYWEPSFFPRYVLASLLGMALLTAAVLNDIGHRRLRAGLTALAVAALGAQAVLYLDTPARRPWGDVKQALEALDEEDVRVHLIGGDPKILEAEARFHLGDGRYAMATIVDPREFGKNTMVHYTAGTMPRETVSRRDVVISFTGPRTRFMEKYMKMNRVHYETTTYEGRWPLFCIELGEK